jgi:hypothetical protein
MKNYDRLMLNEVANSYRKMILNEVANTYKNMLLNEAAAAPPRGKNPNPTFIPYYEVERDAKRYGWERTYTKKGQFKGWKKSRSNPQGAPEQPRPTNPTATTRPRAPGVPAPKPGPRPIRGLRPAVGAAGGILTLLSLYSIYQDLFGDDGVEVDVIPDDGQVIKPINVDQPGLDLQPMQVPEHLRNPHSYPGQHPVRPPKTPPSGGQGSGGGIGGGGGMGM